MVFSQASDKGNAACVGRQRFEQLEPVDFSPAIPGTIFLFDAYEEHDREYTREIDKVVHLWFAIDPRRIFARLLTINKGRVEYERKMLIMENAGLCTAFVQGWDSLRKSPRSWVFPAPQPSPTGIAVWRLNDCSVRKRTLFLFIGGAQVRRYPF